MFKSPLILAVFFTAFLIEAIGSYVSIVGLNELFHHDAIINAMSISLDIAKIVVVSLLFKYGKKLPLVVVSILIPFAATFMFITSAGVGSYLYDGFSKTVSVSNTQNLQIEAMKAEKSKLEARKLQIDQQIANVPSDRNTMRLNLMKQTEAETKHINERLAKIDETLPTLQTENIETEANSSPVLTIAKSVGVTPEQVIKWIVLLICIVFDPTATLLLICGNALLEIEEKKRQVVTVTPTVIEKTEPVVKVEESATVTQPVMEESQESPQEVIVNGDADKPEEIKEAIIPTPSIGADPFALTAQEQKIIDFGADLSTLTLDESFVGVKSRNQEERAIFAGEPAKTKRKNTRRTPKSKVPANESVEQAEEKQAAEVVKSEPVILASSSLESIPMHTPNRFGEYPNEGWRPITKDHGFRP